MAAITVQTAAIAGIALGFRAAAASDTVAVGSDERVLVLVNNGSASPITVTVPAEDTPQVIPGFGSKTIADLTVTVAAGAIEAIGPIGAGYVDAATGVAAVNYSSTTTVTVGAVKVGKPA